MIPAEAIEELLGAYALDAVDANEKRAVEEYLANNPRARAEVEISFREYARAGVPLTALSLAAGVWMLN